VGLREEIAKKIKSAEVRGFDNIEFKPDTVYIRELPAEKAKYGNTTSIEMVVVTKTEDDNLYKTLEQEIGVHGVFGDYFIQLISYTTESPVKALDNVWTRRLSLKIVWEV
jgi:hypothetical protein